LGGSGGSPVVNVEGYTGKPDPDYFTSWSLIGPGFFDTAGMRLLLGRDFTRRDSETAPRVAIVNESFARFYFSGGNPVGKHFGMRRDTGAPIEIVGLVKDAKYQSLRDNHLKMIYIPYRQDLHHLYSMCVLVHPGADSPGIRQTVRDALRAVDPGLPILRIETAEEQVDSSLFEERLIAAISSFFGIVAVLLACLGLYGVMAYQTARRTNEIGVRMALGATRGRVLGMVLEESVWLVAGGIACGIPLTLAATRFVSSKLFGVTPADPITIAAAAILMISVAAVAAFVPARRAAKVDPMVALRYE
jgi:predicted permease